VSTLSNNDGAQQHQHHHQDNNKDGAGSGNDSVDDGSGNPPAKCKATTIPIFLKSKFSN